ncbi:carbohydrate-binding protein [Proteiniphilum sp.]|uniref:carbohydrate-binding protein n=1 Tax=Proteiniphilum sp. TaxID=1926877 RepID=UPI00331F228F
MRTSFFKYGIALLLVSWFCSCDDEYVRTEVDKAISVNITALNSFVGDEIQLIASPTDGTYKYSWSSEDNAIATVDNNGLVIVVGEGNTNIVVSNGDIETKVPVTAIERIPLRDVILSSDVLEMFPGNSKTVFVTYMPENANDIPADEWVSEDENIAAVNANGEISVAGEGITNITYRVGTIVKTVKVDAAYSRPFKGPHILSADAPYELLAANFDTGGEGNAFHDDATIRNNTYRANNGDPGSPQVDIEGDGTNIGYTNAGEWLIYTLDVKDAGTYKVEVNLSANATTGAFHLEIDGQDVTGTVSVPNNGSWNSWRYISDPKMDNINLSEGRHRMKFYFEGAGFNLRGYRFTKI